MKYKYYHFRKETYDLAEYLNHWTKYGFEIITILEPQTNCFDVILRIESKDEREK